MANRQVEATCWRTCLTSRRYFHDHFGTSRAQGRKRNSNLQRWYQKGSQRRRVALQVRNTYRGLIRCSICESVRGKRLESTIVQFDRAETVVVSVFDGGAEPLFAQIRKQKQHFPTFFLSPIHVCIETAFVRAHVNALAGLVFNNTKIYPQARTVLCVHSTS